MSNIKLPYIHQFRDRHRYLRHYFRRRGYPRVSLLGLPGSAEFMAAYKDALGMKKPPIGTVVSRSISELVGRYYLSREYRSLAPATKRTYFNITERLRFEFGDNPVVKLQAEHVRRLIARKADTPQAANSLLKMLRILMKFAMNEGWRADDPTQLVSRVKSKSDGWRTWSEENIAAYETHWPVGTREHLAMALLLYTGQRRSDVIRMGRQHMRNGAIHVRQQKTGTSLSIPVHPTLGAALLSAPVEHLAFLVTAYGRPFTSAGFGNWFAGCVRAAGLVGLSAHGLRKAAARRLAEAGCSAHEIMAITGHRSLKEVDVYTRAADQERLGRSAMARLEK
ncbi:MAG: tyrosine-type recombinase/integrase [Acetobacteraceae bacterium]